MAMIGSLAFCACSNNEEAGDDVNPNDAKQIISLAVANKRHYNACWTSSAQFGGKPDHRERSRICG